MSSKRERVSKSEDVDSFASKFDVMLKAEITKITEKCGLPNGDAVDKLVHLMQLDRTDRKMDISCRTMLADVISSTNRLDCLGRFVQLNGLAVLNEWLQEVHRGKGGNVRSPKEGDESVEDLLLALLRALDKLPVNLLALRSCNIGKSVNLLRSHKNMEIQKKSRSLVDTWKQRVDVEMTKISDVKPPGSCQAVVWPVNSGFGEATKEGSQQRPSPAEAAVEGTTSQSSTCKPVRSRPSHSDSILKSPVTPWASKVVTSVFTTAVSASKDTNAVVGNSGILEVLPTTVKEEKSNGSSQSCCSDQLKAVGSSWKEEARNPSPGSINVCKTSGIASLHKRSNNGLVGTGPSGVQKEKGPSDLQSTDYVRQDYVGHKLIVRLPNPSRSPPHSTSGGSDNTPNGASSPGISDKHGNDQKIKQRSDSCLAEMAMDARTGSWQSDDIKNGQLGSDKADKLLHNSAEEPRNADDACGFTSLSRASYFENGAKIFSSFTAFPAVVEVGMKLLASVAAGEMSRSVSLSSDPCGNTITSSDHIKNIGLCGGDNLLRKPSNGFLGDDKSFVDSQEQLAADDSKKDSLINFQKENRESYLKNDRKLEEGVDQGFSSSTADLNPLFESDGNCRHQDEQKEIGGTADNSLVSKPRSSSLVEKKIVDLTSEKSACGDAADFHGCVNNGGFDSVVCSTKTLKHVAESPSCSSTDEKKLNLWDEENGNSSPGKLHQPVSSEIHSDVSDRVSNDAVAAEKSSSLLATDGETKELTSFAASAVDDHSGLVVFSDSGGEDALDRKETVAPYTSNLSKNEESHPPVGEPEQSTKLTSSKVTEVVVDEGVTTSSLGVAKMAFDLNEGLPGDDDNQTQLSLPSSPLCSSSILIPVLPPFTSSLMWDGSFAQVTVAAPAKVPFSPENLLKGKGEPGWKGSAATSAFRRAEPRKALETPPSAYFIPSSNTSAAKPAFDVDLNVADERVLEDAVSQNSAQTTSSESIVNGNQEAITQQIAGSRDLDLNRKDVALDNGLPLASAWQILEAPLMPLKLAPRVLGHGEVGISSRNFDLNGPGIVDASELGLRSQHAKSNDIPLLPQIAGLRMNNPELGNVSSTWFPTGNSYPTVPIPSFFPDRSEHPFAFVAPARADRVAGPATTSGSTFVDLYRHPGHASSPSSMSFSSATSLQYTGLPFSSRFQLRSNSFLDGCGAYMDSSLGGPCFPTVPSQLLGTATSVSSNYVRPYLISLPEVSTSGGAESRQRWPRQGLDLNTGPDSAEVDVREDKMASASRQVAVVGSQAFPEDHAQLYQFAGGRGLKRKEPEGGVGCDVERFAYKRPSWQ